MGKDSKVSQKPNKKHHHRKDRKGKEERSKKEHYLRKDKESKKQKILDFEATRYTIDAGQCHKLLKILRDLSEYNPDTRTEIPEAFNMLDSGNEIDITDIEDGFIRESLEKIFTIFCKQIEKSEDSEGRFVYSKSGNHNLKEQIENYFEKSKSAPNADHVSELLNPRLGAEFGASPKPIKKETPIHIVDDTEIRRTIQKHDEETRSKSLMEMHLEKNKPAHATGAPEKYIFGHKSMSKRFAPGKFIQ